VYLLGITAVASRLDLEHRQLAIAISAVPFVIGWGNRHRFFWKIGIVASSLAMLITHAPWQWVVVLWVVLLWQLVRENTSATVVWDFQPVNHYTAWEFCVRPYHRRLPVECANCGATHRIVFGHIEWSNEDGDWGKQHAFQCQQCNRYARPMTFQEWGDKNSL